MRDGLLMAGALSKSDPATREAVADIKAERLTGLSVGMIVDHDRWGTASDGRTALREVVDARLIETSIVRRPANPQALITDVRHETRSADHDRVEYRSVPLLVVRQESSDTGADDDGPPEGWDVCPTRSGSGIDAEGTGGKCLTCGGSGMVEDDDEDDRAAGPKYSAEDKARLGRAGKAFKHASDNSYAFPIADREDLSNAIRAVGGRASKSPPEKIRVYIMSRARALGLSSMIPSTWKSDGTLRRSIVIADNEDDLWREYEQVQLKHSRAMAR